MFNLLTVRLFFVLFAFAAVTSVQARTCQVGSDTNETASYQATTQNYPQTTSTEIDTVALIDELISPHWVFHSRTADDWLTYYPDAKIERTPIKNFHNQEKTDTVIEVRTEKTHLRFYRADKKDLLLEANVSFEPLSIGKGLSMGMNKGDFMRQFSETEEGMGQNVVVVVMDEEETNYYFFTFEQNILVAVHYEGIVD
ncbi:hypothetical protein [Bernardetia sp.]|uniref:hypothetical protein n=1 Tax=Bernardetia sp. TaxID=1937974 RepID=UPI0025C1AF65|nr:hypothetical protein [Bernardetia sp.]